MNFKSCTCDCFVIETPLQCSHGFCLGLGKADQAEGYLSQAEWTILKAPECPTALRHKLHRIAGMLYFTKGDYPKARRCLAEDVSAKLFRNSRFWQALQTDNLPNYLAHYQNYLRTLASVCGPRAMVQKVPL